MTHLHVILLHINIHTHTHTHTHTGTDLQPWTFFSRNFTPNCGHTLQSFRGSPWTLCVCVCVCVSSNYLTMDYPPIPYISPCLELLFTCKPMRFATDWRFSDNRGRPWLVCVHSFIVIILMYVHRWRHLQPPPHTHTHIHTGTHKHTGTHTCRPYLFRPSTVDIHFRVFTDDHGLCVCVCVCVCMSTNYLTVDYPLPLCKSMIGFFFFTRMHAYVICYRSAIVWQSWTSMVAVCPRVHGYIVIFLMCVHGWRCLLTHMRTHTHTQKKHTHTHTEKTHTHTHTQKKHTHKNTHRHTHTHTHTHQHAHTQWIFCALTFDVR